MGEDAVTQHTPNLQMQKPRPVYTLTTAPGCTSGQIRVSPCCPPASHLHLPSRALQPHIPHRTAPALPTSSCPSSPRPQSLEEAQLLSLQPSHSPQNRSLHLHLQVHPQQPRAPATLSHAALSDWPPFPSTYQVLRGCFSCRPLDDARFSRGLRPSSLDPPPRAAQVLSQWVWPAPALGESLPFKIEMAPKSTWYPGPLPQRVAAFPKAGSSTKMRPTMSPCPLPLPPSVSDTSRNTLALWLLQILAQNQDVL